MGDLKEFHHSSRWSQLVPIGSFETTGKCFKIYNRIDCIGNLKHLPLDQQGEQTLLSVEKTYL